MTLSPDAVPGVALTLAVLGAVGAALVVAIPLVSFPQLPAFVVCLAVFHFLEFYTTARYNHTLLEPDLFLLFSNGAAYSAAHAFALVEALLTWWAAPAWKRSHPLVLVAGLVVAVAGQTVRLLAMATAGQLFSHNIKHTRADTHTLVTSGVYAWARHPLYAGFFWWAVGTQVMLCNPVSSVVFAAVLWRFFRDRIRYEERLLVEFFGGLYRDYQRSTRSGVPFAT